MLMLRDTAGNQSGGANVVPIIAAVAVVGLIFGAILFFSTQQGSGNNSGQNTTLTQNGQTTPNPASDPGKSQFIPLGSGDPTYKIGDVYPINASNFLPGIPVYNFSVAESNQLQGRWAIISGDHIILVELPKLNRADGGIPTGDDGDKYTDLSAEI